ncbi:MAG: RluA family pseudouridine synthase [Saprospiraceae bacterium]
MQLSELIIFQSHQFVVANKPAGVPTQPDMTGDKSLVDLLSIYCKSDLYVIHRLDRPVSGVVLMAKTKKAAATLNKQFQDKKVEKTYLAVVKEAPEQKDGVLSHYLRKQGKQEKVFKEPGQGALEASLTYETISSSDNYTLLKVVPTTGRFHQIRAQLSAIGSPIKGDVKYGSKRSNPDRSIHLHAWKLSFYHPVTNHKLEFEAPIPDDILWKALMPTAEK